MMYDKFEGGEAGNSFEYHKDQKFSTYDKDNDKHNIKKKISKNSISLMK